MTEKNQNAHKSRSSSILTERAFANRSLWSRRRFTAADHLLVKFASQAALLLPNVKDRMQGPAREENLALIQTIFGENSRAISTLAQLLETPYESRLYVATPITPALSCRSKTGKWSNCHLTSGVGVDLSD